MKLCSFDVETSGELEEYALQPWRVRQGKAWLTSLAWVWREDGKTCHDGGLLPPGKDGVTSCNTMICKLLTWAHETEHTLVGWNVVFDITWLYAYTETDPELLKLLDRVRFLDAMLLWRHLDIEPEYDYKQSRSYSLKAAVSIFFPKYAGYEADIDYHGVDPEKLKELHEYNVKDCYFTLRLAKKFWEGLNHSQQIVAITEAASFKMVARANLDGLIVDTLEAGNLSACLKRTAAEKLVKLAAHGITPKIVRSPKQLGKVLFEEWNLPVLAQTSTGARSTDKAVLHKLALRDKRVREIKEYREALNNDTKFAVAPLASVAYNQDSRSHPQARVFGTYSGRLTISSKQGKNKGERQIGFALHQMKRDPTFRRIIVPPPGYTLMEFDAAGQEYRWMAIASGDSTMLKLCEPGEDPHAYMGSRINSMFSYKQVMKNAKVAGSEEANLRQCGKVVTLSSQYRVGFKKLQQIAEVDYGISMSLDEAQRIQRVYLQTYPGIHRYWATQIQSAQATGYVETIPGRRVRVVGHWGGDISWQMESTAINYRIQGCLQGHVRVMTDIGMIPIRELVGKYFSVWTGHRWASATAVLRGECQLAEVELESGEIIECDTRHKLKGDDRSWLDFKTLIPGIRIALPRMRQPLAASSQVTWPYVLGYYLGDGWISIKKRVRGWQRNVCFVGGVDSMHNLQRLYYFFLSQGFVTYFRQNRPTVWTLNSYSRELFDKMIVLGVTPNLLARTKRVPDLVWRLDEQGRRDFWEGVYHSDGSKVQRQEGNVHSPNLDLIRDLQKLAASIGIASHITKTSTAWLLRVLRTDGGYYPKDVLLRDLDGFVPPCQLGDCESIVNRRAVLGTQQVTQRVAERIYDCWLPDQEVYRYGVIKTIRHLDRFETTFTLSVDDHLHQFVADGVIHKNTGAEQKYLALRVVRKYLSEIGARFAWDLHDGLYFYVPHERVEEAAYHIKDLLDNLPYEAVWRFKPPIPMPWDCKVGPSWGDLKPFEFK